MLLGGFDGLHVGHKKLLCRARTYGLPVGIMTIVGGKTDKSLFTSEERKTIFKNAGIDFVFELPFLEIKSLSPADFASLLIKKFPVKAFVCGDDFRFGAGAEGTPETLKASTQVCVHVEELVKVKGEKVSATALKRLLENGDIETANTLLDEPFFLTGKVFEDRKVGRTLGFPTANIEYPKEKFPLKQGVYETRVTIDGKEYKGITNYGSRPTFLNTATLTETHLCGFSGDLYGRELTVRFLRFLREIKKFANPAALQAQLQTDIRSVENYD